MTPQGLIVALIAISLLIIVHEAGHYFVAKWCKMRVERFSLGFGPAIASWTHKGTQFQLAPIPFGGFVEIQGMNIVEEVDPDDIYAYPNRPVWQRILTIFAGPATNFLFAIVLAFALFTIAGMQTGNTFIGVSAISEGFDADGALQEGDVLVTIQRQSDPKPIHIFNQYNGQRGPSLATLVHESKGEPMKVVIRRDGELLPAMELRAKPDPELTWDKTDEPQYRLGIGLRLVAERVDVGFFTAAKEALYYPVFKTKEIYQQIRKMIEGEQEGRLTGPVGIAETISQAVEFGWIIALSWFMMINVWLGLVNLLPLPALDGGRLVFLLYELATRRRANPKIEATVHMVGIMLLLLLMIAVTYNDCARLL